MTPPAATSAQATTAALAACVLVAVICFAIAAVIGDIHPIRWTRARVAVLDTVLAWCDFGARQFAGRVAAAARTANQWRRLQFGADQTPNWQVGELTGEQPTVPTPYVDEPDDEQDTDDPTRDDDEMSDEQERAAEIARKADQWCRDHGLADLRPVSKPLVDEPAGDEPPMDSTYRPRHHLGAVTGTDAQRAQWARWADTAAYPAITTHQPEGVAA